MIRFAARVLRWRQVRALVVLSVGVFTVSACSLDGYLFNEQAVERYTLSAAVIPDSLRTEGEWQVGGDRVAWVLARRPGAAPRLSLLYCHGNKDNIEEYWSRVETFWSAGFDVLIFDYRGFGRSTGTSSEATMRADGEAALAFLRSRGVTDSSLVVAGFSLGGVCAIHLASRIVMPRALIVESAFTSSEALVRSGTVLDVPGRWLVKDPFDNLAAIRGVRAPTLVVHGEADTFIPFAFGEAVFAASGAATKRFVRIRGADHTDIPTVIGAARYGQLYHDFARAPSANGPTLLP
jgi:hypothetical protein